MKKKTSNKKTLNTNNIKSQNKVFELSTVRISLTFKLKK